MKKVLSVLIILVLSLVAPLGVFAADGLAILDVNLMSQDPDPVVAGDVVEVRFSVENIGYDSSNDLIVSVEEEFPFEVVSSNQLNIGALLSGQNDENKQIVKFTLKVDKDVKAGAQQMTLNVLDTQNGVTLTYDFDVDIKTKNSLEIESIDKSEIVPGKKETITFKLTNVGSSNLDDIIFSWENVDEVILPVGSDNSVYIKSIPVGQSVDIAFDVLASSSVTADLYNLDLKISYQDSISSEVYESITKTGIYVGGDTSFDLVFDEVSGSEYAFTISNIGANNAESVTIKVPSQDGWTINSGSSEIIGNLNKGDYTTVSFAMTKGKAQAIDLIIDYTNTLGERVSIEKLVDVASSESTVDGVAVERDGSGGGMRSMTSGVTNIVTYAKYFGYAVLILIVLVIGRKVYKKRRK
ncbi:MAG: COG1361 S-layer family protein [Candidatus Woesearchaeota archaeon]|jgi:hypothetical protein|nr:COG1361 S-layer family protein [Candidatus Woesearchaeota archaeon]